MMVILHGRGSIAKGIYTIPRLSCHNILFDID